MPNIDSARKALRQSEVRRVHNLRRIRAMRGLMKDIERAVSKKDKVAAAGLLVNTYKAIDKAAKRGVIKPNTASRKKSRVARLVATL